MGGVPVLKASGITKTIFSVASLSALITGCGAVNPVQNASGSRASDTAISKETSQNQDQSQTQTKPASVKAPQFIMPTIGGKNVSLQQLLSKKEPIVVNYFASWCPECNAEMPDFTSVSRQFAGKVQFIGVDAIGEDTTNGVKEFIKKYHIQYPVILDNGNKVASEYSLAGHPETVIISPNGTYIGTFPGPVTKEQLTQELNQIFKKN
jgi:cytochrome c biogenesis protein CcmG, thiol:disulfide interchange protein DsbE